MPNISRRKFLFSAAMMGGAAGHSAEDIVNRFVSYANPPTPIRPGIWSTFATVCRKCPAGCGMHCSFRDGRVTKAVGNPLHPVNRGRLCARGQSSVQGLYDPDRLSAPATRTSSSEPLAPVAWDDALSRIGALLKTAGNRVAVIADLQTGTLVDLMHQFAGSFGSDRALLYEPAGYDAQRLAHAQLFGRDSVPSYNLADADIIISFAADFLETWISPVEYAVDYAAMHALKNGSMGRMVYVGPRLSMTAANADDFFRVSPGSERFIALAMVDAMVKNGWVKNDPEGVRRMADALGASQAAGHAHIPTDRIEALAREFADARSSVALAGPAGAVGAVARDTAVAVALLNYAAGRIGTTVDFSSSHAVSNAATAGELDLFLGQITHGDVIFINNCNIAYSNKQAMSALRRAGTIVYLTTLADETADLADWVLPVDSPLETWGDYEPCIGVQGLQQPVMNRLHDARSTGDLLLQCAAAAGHSLASGSFLDLLQKRWQSIHAASGAMVPFSQFWETSLRRGGFWGNAGKPGTLESPGRVGKIDLVSATPAPFAPVKAAATGVTADLVLAPSIMFFDGRPSNRGWLQEAPDPVSYAVWGSCIDIHPYQASRISLHEGDAVELQSAAGSCRAPVRITEDVAPWSAGLLLGQGHTAAGLSIARNIGANGFDLIDRKENGSLFFTVEIKKSAAGTLRSTQRRRATSFIGTFSGPSASPKSLQ